MKISKIEKDENANISYRTLRQVITLCIPVHTHKIALVRDNVYIDCS